MKARKDEFPYGLFYFHSICDGHLVRLYMDEGIVIKAHSNNYDVQVNTQLYRCSLRHHIIEEYICIRTVNIAKAEFLVKRVTI